MSKNIEIKFLSKKAMVKSMGITTVHHIETKKEEDEFLIYVSNVVQGKLANNLQDREWV